MSCADQPDPDAVPLGSAEAIAYDAEAMRLGAAAGVEPVAREAYGPDRGQRLDVYAPAGAKDLPALLFFHGGAWISGHLGWLRFMAPAALQRDCVFVAATYRLAPRLRWPAQREDAQAALAWVRANLARFGGDPARIAIGGHSAGGHLAAVTALLDANAARLRVCLPVSAPLDLRYGDVPRESGEGRVYKYLLARREDDAGASPVTYAAGARVPFRLTWGERDFDRVLRSNAAMAAALPQAETFAAPGASHFETHLALADPAHPWWNWVA